eukprot:gene7693-15745_t
MVLLGFTNRNALILFWLSATHIFSSKITNEVYQPYEWKSSKVIIPAVFNEWDDGIPFWANSPITEKRFGYTTFVYQKKDPNKANYIPYNRGTEGGVYLKFIVDHYNNLPDIMVFVQANPLDHSPFFLKLVRCISPNATYSSINSHPGYDMNYMCKNTSEWVKIEVWVEQCWRDILQKTWNLEGNLNAFHKILPITAPIRVCCTCCQQFFVSRAKVRERPHSFWKELYEIIGVQNACHLGEPDYHNLYAYYHKNEIKVGAEPSALRAFDEDMNTAGYGRHTQGGAMEHLAHVIFGGMDLIQPHVSDQKENLRMNNYLSKCLRKSQL